MTAAIQADQTRDVLVAAGGWASSAEARAEAMSYVSRGPTDPEPTTAAVDWWEPPHPMALTASEVDEWMELLPHLRPKSTRTGTYHFLEGGRFPPQLLQRLSDRLDAANAMWWRLDIDDLSAGLKRYRPGEAHPEHTDWVPGFSGRRKLVGGVQLSDPDDYEGGDFDIHYAGSVYTVPFTRGTFVAFPGWTHHEITEITSGERFSLVVNGWGPPIR